MVLTVLERFKKLRSETSTFFRTLARVAILAWRVSPGLYLAQLVLNVISGLMPLLSAFLGGLIVTRLADTLTAGAPLQPVYWLVLALAGAQLLANQLGYLASYLDDLFSLQFDGYIQEQLIRTFARLDQTYYDDPAFNDRVNKVNQNIMAMGALNGRLFQLMSGGVQIIATGIALFALQPLLVPVIMLAVLPLMVIELRTSIKRWKFWDERGDTWRMQWYLRSTMTDVATIREIKLYRLVDWFARRWRKAFEEARRGQVDIERFAQRQRAASGVLDALVQVGIQLWLVTLVLGRGTAGLGLFIFYRQAVQSFSGASTGMVRTLHTLQERSLYVNDYFELLALEPRIKAPEHPAALPGLGAPRIVFDNVSFRYADDTPWVLRHVNLIIEPGQDVAIVGENGAGKSTLVKLLLRLYAPTEGRITAGGIDLRDLDPDDWNRRLGILFQDFNQYGPLTVRDNILTGDAEAEESEDRLKAAAAQSGAEGFIKSLNHGYDQRLSKNFKDGVGVSGGQWQRIALARAFYRGAPVLILDEPTSAIDAKGEYEIFQEIARTQREKTTIIISHRFSTVRNADRIVVIEHGEVTEQGTHEELLGRAGTYASLFETQAAGYR